MFDVISPKLSTAFTWNFRWLMPHIQWCCDPKFSLKVLLVFVNEMIIYCSVWQNYQKFFDNRCLFPNSKSYLADFNTVQRDNYALPLYQVSFVNNQPNTCYGWFCKSQSHWNCINICVNAPRFEIPITRQRKVLLLSKSSMRWKIDASLMWRCLKFEINFRSAVSCVIKSVRS